MSRTIVYNVLLAVLLLGVPLLWIASLRPAFDNPLYLLLLLGLPLLWVFSYRSLSGLGTTRRTISTV